LRCIWEDVGEGGSVEEQRLRQRIAPLVRNVVGCPAQKRAIVVGEPTEQDDRAPPLFTPQFAFGDVGRFRA
jgi:hypothetical protein